MSRVTPPRRAGRSAVVVGASLAGLCTARVLSERFDRVTVIDRDALPDGADHRAHVPQGRHPHLLLSAGRQLLSAWFPGLVDELVAGGATVVDTCRDFYWFQSGGALRRPASDLCGPSMSRPLLEWTVRRRVAALGNVTIRDCTGATGLRCDPTGGRVTGVELDDGSTLAADLVVDASGRQARSVRWLADLGYEPPEVSTVEIDLRYVTRVYRRSELPERDWHVAVVVGEPATKRQAMLLPLEGDRWILTVIGFHGESAPAGAGSDGDVEAEFLAYVRDLESPVIADVVATSELLRGPVTHRFPANQRRHVERMRRFPLGWVMLGDSVCSFDPVYGQGMTSAAQQAMALGRCLDRAGAIDRRFGRSFFKAAGRVVAVPWSIAAGGDFVYPETTGPKAPGTDLLNRYVDRAFVAGQHDDQVVVRLGEVLELVRRPEALLTPPFVLRVLRGSRRARRAQASRRQGGPRPSGGASPTPGRVDLPVDQSAG